jgi:hypothetical protein
MKNMHYKKLRDKVLMHMFGAKDEASKQASKHIKPLIHCNTDTSSSYVLWKNPVQNLALLKIR